MAIFNKRNAVVGWIALKLGSARRSRRPSAVPVPGRAAAAPPPRARSAASSACCSSCAGSAAATARGAARSDPGLFRQAIDGLVPYEPGKPVEEVQRELGLDRVVKLASNEGPFPPFPAALEAIERAAPRPESISGRRGWALRVGARRAARRRARGGGRRGRAPTAVIDWLSQATLDPGDEIVCGWPSFPSYVLDAAKLGAEPWKVPLRETRTTSTALLAAIGPRTKLVYVCHPNNPTGTANGRGRARRASSSRFRSTCSSCSTRRTSSTSTIPTTRTASRSTSRRGGASSSCGRSRRSTGSRGCASATASGPPTWSSATSKVRRAFDVTATGAGGGAREHRRRGGARPAARRERRRARAARRSAPRPRARAGGPGARQLPLRGGRRRPGALRAAPAPGRDRPAVARRSARPRRSASRSARRRRIERLRRRARPRPFGRLVLNANKPVTLRHQCAVLPRGSWRRCAAPGFRLLFLSTLGSSIGTLLAAIALAIDVKDRTDSGLWVGAVLIVEFLPTILVGLTLGPLLDRLDAPALMVVADLVRAAVFAALPFATSAAQIVALALVAGLANGFFRPAVYAGVPNLVAGRAARRGKCAAPDGRERELGGRPGLGGILAAAAGPGRRVLDQRRRRSSSRRCSSSRIPRRCCRARRRSDARALDGPRGRIPSRSSGRGRCSRCSSPGASPRSAAARSASARSSWRRTPSTRATSATASSTAASAPARDRKLLEQRDRRAHRHARALQRCARA